MQQLQADVPYLPKTLWQHDAAVTGHGEWSMQKVYLVTGGYCDAGECVPLCSVPAARVPR